MNALQLNADFTPLRVIPWETAVELVLEDRAVVQTAYGDRFVRSERLALPWPAVISMKRYIKPRSRVKFSPRHVFARDGYQCAYCGLAPRQASGRPDLLELSLDHVVPRAQAKHGAVYAPWVQRWVNVTCWENAATACRACNQRKADRTPTEAGMHLRIRPRAPTPADVFRIQLQRIARIEPEWEPYLAGWLVEAAPSRGVETPVAEAGPRLAEAGPRLVKVK